MVILNGRATGENRVAYEDQVSSADVWLNGQSVASPSDFNQNAYIIEKVITLQDANLLEVELRSSPGSFITIRIIDQDQTPPTLSVISPGTDPFVADQPEITVEGITDDASASITVNGLAAQSTGLSFSASIFLLEGENLLTVRAVDPCGNFSQTVFTVIYSPHEASAYIGPEGGEVFVTDPESPIYGAGVIIPAGLLTEYIVITLDPVDYPLLPPASGVFPIGPAVEFGPAGTVFPAPIEVVAPYNEEKILTETAASEGDVDPFLYYPDTNLYFSLPLISRDPVNNLFHFSMTHFSDEIPAITDETPPVTEISVSGPKYLAPLDNFRFVNSSRVPPLGSVYEVKLMDFDQDNDLDLVFFSEYEFQGVILNDGHGWFSSAPTMQTDVMPTGIDLQNCSATRLIDFDRDSDPDIFTRCNYEVTCPPPQRDIPPSTGPCYESRWVFLENDLGGSSKRFLDVSDNIMDWNYCPDYQIMIV